MATTTMDYENANGDRYDGRQHASRAQLKFLCNSRLTNMPLDEPRGYERDQRSASPRAMRDDPENGRRRSASPGTSADRYVHHNSIRLAILLLSSSSADHPRMTAAPRTTTMEPSIPDQTCLSPAFIPS